MDLDFLQFFHICIGLEESGAAQDGDIAVQALGDVVQGNLVEGFHTLHEQVHRCLGINSQDSFAGVGEADGSLDACIADEEVAQGEGVIRNLDGGAALDGIVLVQFAVTILVFHGGIDDGIQEQFAVFGYVDGSLGRDGHFHNLDFRFTRFNGLVLTRGDGDAIPVVTFAFQLGLVGFAVEHIGDIERIVALGVLEVVVLYGDIAFHQGKLDQGGGSGLRVSFHDAGHGIPQVLGDLLYVTTFYLLDGIDEFHAGLGPGVPVVRVHLVECVHGGIGQFLLDFRCGHGLCGLNGLRVLFAGNGCEGKDAGAED